MQPTVIARPHQQSLTVLRGWAVSEELTGGLMVGDGTWLTMSEVVTRFRAAGFADSESTIRRLIDDGDLASYRQRGRGGRTGHRRVRASSVDDYLRGRTQAEGGP